MSDPAWQPVLGRVPSGLFILSATRGGVDAAMLASWVMQAGFEPPSISVAVRSDRALATWLVEGDPFAVHLLPQNDLRLLKHFSRGFEPGDDVFAGLEIERTPSGVALLPQALAFLECRATASVNSGDHRVIIAEITDGRLFRDEPPRVHIRSSGARY